eukprot:7547915-Pyramimonas_sp.AAC.1
MRDHALVDTAAGQALIGTPDVKNLVEAFRKRGYFVFVDWTPLDGRKASGIGGLAKTVGRAWVLSLIHI